MQPSTKPTFDLRAALDASQTRFSVATYDPKEIIFLQGDPSDCVMYVEEGSVRLTVTASNGKEATLGLLAPGAFLGEEVLIGRADRPNNATAMTKTTVLEVATPEMIQRLGTRHPLAERFIAYIVGRNIRLEADLIDQLFNSCEKRVARTLMLLAERSQPQLPPLSQEVIAEMVGTTRSRVNLFMNKFKRLGFIEYDNGLKVNPSLMTFVHD